MYILYITFFFENGRALVKNEFNTEQISKKKMNTLFKIIKNIDSTTNPFDMPTFQGGHHEL